MVLLGRILRCPPTGRLFGLRSGIGRLPCFDMAAKPEAHGREHLLAKGVVTARAEPRIKRGREYVAAYVRFMHYAERLHAAADPEAGPAEHRAARTLEEHSH